MKITKIALLLALSLGLSACFNADNEKRVNLGTVSLGDQLIDLKKAHEAGAIDSAEYQQMRLGLINLVADEDFDDDDDDDDDDKRKKRRNRKSDSDDDDGFSWL